MESSPTSLQSIVSAQLSKDSSVIAAYLFGSQARGTATQRSDVDVGVLLDRQPSQDLDGLPGELQFGLEKAVGKPVNIVVLNQASADLVHKVLRDGILLLDRHPKRRTQFETRSRAHYFDMLPHWKRYRRMESP